MSDLFTTRTASLRATKGDFNKIILKNKNILDYINEADFKNFDNRDPQLKNDELDVWNTAISLSEEGYIEVKPQIHSINDNTFEGITETQVNTIKTAVKVIDNEVLGENDEHIMYWQTDGLTDGCCTFISCPKLTTFTSGLSSLTDCEAMFLDCENLTSFSSDLSSLTYGNSMFFNCSNLTSFTSDLPSLTDGSAMFEECSQLTLFSPDLPNLTNGHFMFNNCHNLTSFSSDLPSLTNGERMFNSCSNFTSFSSDLPSLTNGWGMFSGCSNLKSFSSDLLSLVNGMSMFNNCKIDTKSVSNIIHSIPQRDTAPVRNEGSIDIGIGCDNTEADQLLFAQECDCETWQELLDDFSAKNWEVTFQCNGRPTEAATYGMRRGETLPIYAKLEEVTDEKHAQYTSADSSKFFNIHYFHSTNGSTGGYDVFSSLEEAISTYNVTPKN